MHLLSCACLLVCLSLELTHAQRVVATEYGPVRGHMVNVDNGVEQTKVEVFYSIPFGKDTSGPRRFKAPERPDPWTDIMEADTMKEACPQYTGSIEIFVPDWPLSGYGEDCLHMNIFTPEVVEGEEAQALYPVMFFIYGGAYQYGGNIQYPGHYLASRDVIVVIPNYRLTTFGFAFTGTDNDACPGNAGMWDQLAALQFVKENIANFGGDPSKITVFGQSAGGTSTSLHLLSPHSKDLFHGAIIESGAETTDWTINLPQSHPENYMYQVAEDLGCTRPDDYDMMDCLRQLTWREILYNSTFTCEPGYTCMGMIPVVDGPGGFVPKLPVDMRRDGSVMNGPIISGITEEDGSMFLPYIIPGVINEDCCNRSFFSFALKERIVTYFEPRLSNMTAEAVYRAFEFNYSPWPNIYDTDANRDMLVKLYTDWSYGVPWDRQLKDHQKVAPTYGYLYDYRSANSSLSDWLGTVHSAENDYVWGYALMDLNEEVRNDSHYRVGGRVYNAFDYEYAVFMQELWTNFAKYGNPTPSPVNNPLGGTTMWPQFTTDAMDIIYLGAESIHTLTQYSQADYAFWTEYLMWMSGDELGISDNWDDDFTDG